METNNKKVEICEVCAANKAKFTCPKCEVRTCCLQCVKIHKQELECDGIRDKTKFIPLNSFTDLDLLSDYRLLEEIGRSVDRFKKNPAKKFTRQQNLPKQLHILKNAAQKRGVKLDFMPRNFSRNLENSTFCDWKSHELFWTVEFIFPQAENLKWIVNRVEEKKRLSSVLEEILNPSVVEGQQSEEMAKLSILQSKLKFYQAAGLSGLKMLLKAEKIEKASSKFYELDLTQSLQENLRNKSVIEFPIIYVILKDHSDMFEIIESDDEESNSYDFNHVNEQECQEPKPWNRKRKNNQRYNNRSKKNQQKSDSIPSELPSVKKTDTNVNYFFNDDVTDSEDENKKVIAQNLNEEGFNRGIDIAD